MAETKDNEGLPRRRGPKALLKSVAALPGTSDQLADLAKTADRLAKQPKNPGGRPPGSVNPDSMITRMANLDINGTFCVSSRSPVTEMNSKTAREEAARLASSLAPIVSRAAKASGNTYKVESGYFETRDDAFICVANAVRTA